MSKPVVIIADIDKEYLAPLELKVIEELGDKVDLEVISDPDYFESYFSDPRKAELLIVGESLYSSEIQKHNLGNIFVLTEKATSGETGDPNVSKIFKYASLKEIFSEIMFASSSALLGDSAVDRKTQVVICYSAVGGAGKTTMALGVSAGLTQAYKRVLYIDAEHIQNFHYYLADKSYASDKVYHELNSKNDQIYNNIRSHIRHEKFDYLPPFRASLSALNVEYAVFFNLIKDVKASKDYDFIVVDVDSVFNGEKASLFGLADKVLVLLTQDEYSAFKTDALTNSINCSDTDKYLFVCNKFEVEEKNALSDDKKSKVTVSEYVENIEDCGALTVKRMLDIDGFKKITYALI